MTSFEDRERSFEKKFAMDEELKFKAEARRNKMLGEWAAGLMGLLSGLLTAMAYLQVSALGKAGEPEGRVVFYFSLCSIGAGALVTSLVSGWHAHTLKGLGMLLAVGLLATLAQYMPKPLVARRIPEHLAAEDLAGDLDLFRQRV